MEPPRKCHKCERKADVKTIDKWLCRHCFTRQIEDKLKHNLRQYNIKKDSKLYAPDMACKHIISKVINRPVRIVSTKSKADHIIRPWTLDHENEAFLKGLFKNKLPAKKAKKRERVIKLFLPATIDDMKQYFSIKNVPYKAEKSRLIKMLDGMEHKYPGLKASLGRSHDKITELCAK
jgi:hypothetical protein